MSFLQAIFLGILQGLTEFLPVSSSGHLVLFEHILQIQFDPAMLQSFDIVLHAGTATAILWAYRAYWWQLLRGMWKIGSDSYTQVKLLILATIPAGITGVVFEQAITEYFRSLYAIAICFILTGVVLLAVRKKTARQTKPNTTHALWMGLAQAIAIIPGISRSGSTIAAGLFSGLEQKKAVDFSFQMALPIIMGAFVLTLKDVVTGDVILPSAALCITGFISSFIVSLIALYTIRVFVRSHSISWFAAYLLPLGVLTYIFL